MKKTVSTIKYLAELFTAFVVLDLRTAYLVILSTRSFALLHINKLEEHFSPLLHLNPLHENVFR